MSLSDYDPLITEAAKQYASLAGIDPDALANIARAHFMAETNNADPNAVGPDTKYGNAVGIAQLIPDTAQRLGVTDPKDPTQAIPGAIRLMAENLKHYKGDVSKAVSSYHGSWDEKQWGPKTRAYAANVLGKLKTLSPDKSPAMQTEEDDPLDAELNARLSQGEVDPLDEEITQRLAAPAMAPVKTTPLSTEKASEKKTPSLIDIIKNRIENIDPAFGTGVEYGLGDTPKGVGYLADEAQGGSVAEKARQNRLLRNNEIAKLPNQDFIQAGRVVGELPAAMAAGFAATRGIRAAGAAIPAVAPALEFLAGNAGRAGSGVLNSLLQGGSKAVSGALQGAAVTPMSYAGNNEDLGTQAARNAEFGGVLNPLMAGAGALGARVGEYLKPAKDFVQNKLLQKMVEDTGSPEAAIERLQSLGPEASTADVGPNSMRLVRKAANTPGEGSAKIVNSLDERQMDQGARVSESLRKEMGVSGTYDDALSQLDKQAREGAAPLYKEAFSSNKNMASPKIDRILETPEGQKALQSARVRMQNKMALMGVPDSELTEQARDAGILASGQKVSSGLKMETLDLVKQELQQEARRMQRGVVNGSVKQSEVNDINDLAGGLTDELDRLDVTAKAGPNSTKPGAYSRARAAWGGPQQSKEAMQMGSDFIDNPAKIDAKKLAKLTEDQKKLFRLGATQNLENTVNSIKDRSNVYDRIFASKAARKTLSSVFPDEASFNNFEKTMNAENQFHKTRAGIRNVSQTFPMMAEAAEDDLPGDVARVAGHVADIKSGGILRPAMAAGRAGWNRLTGMTPERVDQIAEMAFPSTPDARQKLLVGLTEYGKTSGKKTMPGFLKFITGADAVPMLTLGYNRLIDAEQSRH